MSTFTARYHSQCASCDGHISPGDSALWLDDEVVHVLCANPDRHTPAPVVVCGECWMTTPCWCDADT